jgi:hypothetical protein
LSEEEFDLAPRDTPATKFDHIIYHSLDPEKSSEPEIRGDEAGLAEAAAELRQTPGERNEITERTWGDPRDWSKHAPGNLVVSAEHASDMLKEARDWEQQVAQSGVDAEIARAVDELRAGDAQQPTVQPEPQAQELQPQLETAPAEVSELDRMLAELPEHRRAPFVTAFNEMVTRAQHQASTEYQQAVQQAQAVAQQNEQAAAQTLLRGEALLLSQAPELAQVPREQRLLALDILEKQNPQRAAQIRALDRQIGMHLQNEAYQVQVAQQRQQQAQQQQVEAQKQQFRQYADYHDSRTLLNETPEVRTAIQNTLIADAEKEGIDKQTLAQIWNSNPVARHSFFQNLIADGMKYRLAQRSIPKAVTRTVPRVQRPGVANQESRDYSETAALQRRFSERPTLKNAAELVAARRGSR